MPAVRRSTPARKPPSYRDLQRLCKARGIASNRKRDVLVSELTKLGVLDADGTARKEQAAGQQADKGVRTAGDEGYTADGTQFRVPRTLNTVSLLYPWNVTPATVLTMVPLVAHAVAIARRQVSTEASIAIFIFWRLAYALGLGCTLRSQSRKQAVTRWYERWARAGGVRGWLARRLAVWGQAERGFNPDENPADLNAWLCHRVLVTFILVNDGLNYALLPFQVYEQPEWPLSNGFILRLAVGIVLIRINIWAKVSAHRGIGDYCWYWGDFFFRKNTQLDFSGIFELFPHPMYTVGYSAYYGLSLITGSYRLFLTSLFAHVMLLLFLLFVEEPHIEKTYGKPNARLSAQERRILYDAKEGLFPAKKDPVYLLNLDIHRASDAGLLAASALLVALMFAVSMRSAVCVLVILRVAHWAGLAWVLWAQSNFRSFTLHYVRNCRSLQEAFSEWKRLYNISMTLNVLAFVTLFLRELSVEAHLEACLSSTRRAAEVAVGMLLTAVSLHVSYSSYESVGEFGWFFGDFFIPQHMYTRALSYGGAYRFLNDPDSSAGYLYGYGLALICRSWMLFYAACLTQLASFVFVFAVERPHMRRMYTKMREKNPLRRKLSKIVDRVVGSDSPRSSRRVGAVKAAILGRVADSLYSTVAPPPIDSGSLGGRASPGLGSPSFSVSLELEKREYTSNDPAIVVEFSRKGLSSDLDWVGLYPRGVRSAPGRSEGMWNYVPAGGRGKVTIPVTKAMIAMGEELWEARYHIGNSYGVLAMVPFRLAL